ncbi:MAG: hypothetical protein HFJ41_00125 [Clostridia bacterium]|nr:hypothetical protein [Clostridia bacterium]
MKSFCIKTNNDNIINYLLNNLSSIDFEDIYFIDKKFKIYKNVIIHYKGTKENEFLNLIASLISECILLFFEPLLIKRCINLNYFYFDDFEKKLIEKNCYNYIQIDEDDTLKYRKNEIWVNVLNYLLENKSMFLDGFVNFRLDNYLDTINDIVDYSVNKYIVEKEYTEFINLLKIYIDSKQSEADLVHLVYTNGESILLDSNRNIISLSDNIFNAKYLSDISFSSNDYALNALLTLLPKRIELHVIGYEDEFINTLKLIFGNRIFICRDCNICRTYKILTNTKGV